MKQFRDYVVDTIPIVDHLTQETKKQTDMLVDMVYSHYVKEYTKNQPECVGWMDGTENALTRNEKLYEAGILDEDSILDVGCGDFFGTRQHGYIKSKIANFVEDGPIIRQTRKRAFQMVEYDPKLKLDQHEKIKNQFKENYRHMLEFVNIS